MHRSFTDRVLGGVCGGLGVLLPLNAWWWRVAFAVLTVMTLGAFGLLYLALWMLIPQKSLVGRQRGGSGLFLLTLILMVATGAGWLVWLNGGLRGPAGEPVYWGLLLVVVAGIYFLRQLRG